MDLALNNLQKLICHKTQQTNKQTNFSHGVSMENNAYGKHWNCAPVKASGTFFLMTLP